MERELEKTLMEIECAIKSHEQRGNTHTQSVLEQARDIIGMCAQAAKTPSELKEILERDTARDNYGWIPVEERLPERGGGWQVSCYEVTIILNGRHLVTTAAYDYAGRKWMTKSKVIAWRPLPEPYRPKKESEGSRRLREREEFFKG